MFRTSFIHSGTIVSDEGYTVKLLTRYTLVYQDGPVSVTFEKDSVPGQMDVFLSSARSVGMEEFAMDGGPAAVQILERLRRALAWKGFAVRFIGQLSCCYSARG